MNFRHLYFVLSCLCLIVNAVQAQHYSPDVYYHDAAQRRFPVEAARVLAWIVNQNESLISGVTWDASGKADGTSEWKLSWVANTGNEIASCKLEVDLTALNSGPEYYRKVWTQLSEALKKHVPGPSADESDSSLQGDEFWDEELSRSRSRMAMVMAVHDYLKSHHPERRAPAALSLASLLIHGSKSILAGQVSLDASSLSRAAAWLCHAEVIGKRRLQREWCPLLYLAARERPASKLWIQAEGKPSSEGNAGIWNLMLADYPAKVRNVVNHAATHEKQRFECLPFLLSYVNFDSGFQEPLGRVLDMLYGKALLKHGDHMPFLTRAYALGDMRSLCELQVLTARKEWLQTLAAIDPKDEAGRQAESALKVIMAGLEPDPLLSGLEACSGLLEQGAVTTSGSLSPAAGHTTQDLIVHGWDMTHEHMHAWYDFLARILGVAEQADRLREVVRKIVPSMTTALSPLLMGEKATLSVPVNRFESTEVYGLVQRAAFAGKSIIAKDDKPNSAAVTLRNPFKRGSCAALLYGKLRSSQSDLINEIRVARLLLEQGSESSLASMSTSLHIQPTKSYFTTLMDEHGDLLQAVQDATPNALSVQRNILDYGRSSRAKTAFANAEELERLFWASPSLTGVSSVFFKYVAANGLAQAKRIYEEGARLGESSSLSMSNNVAPGRWALAWHEKDADGMNSAAGDHPSFSSLDLQKQALHAFVQNNHAKAREICQASMMRYTRPSSSGRINWDAWLHEMTILLPALKNSADTDHAKAVNHFKKAANFPDCQVIALVHAGLASVASAEWFEETNPNGLLILGWLKKEKEVCERAYKSMQRPYNGIWSVLMSLMMHEIRPTPPLTNTAPLKPAEETRLDVLVREILNKGGR